MNDVNNDGSGSNKDLRGGRSGGERVVVGIVVLVRPGSVNGGSSS